MREGGARELYYEGAVKGSRAPTLLLLLLLLEPLPLLRELTLQSVATHHGEFLLTEGVATMLRGHSGGMVGA